MIAEMPPDESLGAFCVSGGGKLTLLAPRWKQRGAFF